MQLDLISGVDIEDLSIERIALWFLSTLIFYSLKKLYMYLDLISGFVIEDLSTEPNAFMILEYSNFL